jgi:hypothetical protein
MKSNTDNEPDKSEKKSESAATPAAESAVVSSNRNSLAQEWQKYIRHFNYSYNLDFLTCSTRKRFCTAAISSLQLLYDATKGDKRLEDNLDVKSIIDSLKSSQSNAEIVTLFRSLPNKSNLQKLVRDKKIPMELGRLMDHMRGCYFADLDCQPDKMLPVSAFEYQKLIELPLHSRISSGDFEALSSQDFIVFSAEGGSSSVNDTKLRLSIAENQFEKAWDLLKQTFLFPDSPIHHFKIINFKHSSDRLNSFVEKYKKYKTGDAESLSDDSYYQKQLEDSQRLTAGGQITIYLPRDLDQAKSERITEFFEKITTILRDNEIAAGVQPSSDRSLSAYISGRVGGTEFDYIPSTDTTKNSTDQVLGYFSTALNKTGNTPTSQQ